MYENTCKAKMRYTDKWKSKQYEKYNSKCMFFFKNKKVEGEKMSDCEYQGRILLCWYVAAEMLLKMRVEEEKGVFHKSQLKMWLLFTCV